MTHVKKSMQGVHSMHCTSLRKGCSHHIFNGIEHLPSWLFNAHLVHHEAKYFSRVNPMHNWRGWVGCYKTSFVKNLALSPFCGQHLAWFSATCRRNRPPRCPNNVIEQLTNHSLIDDTHVDKLEEHHDVWINVVVHIEGLIQHIPIKL